MWTTTRRTIAGALLSVLFGIAGPVRASAAPPASESPAPPARAALPADGESAPAPEPLRWQDDRPGPPAIPADGEDRELEHLSRALSLSSEQRLAVVELLARERVQAERLRARLSEARQKLAQALDAAKPQPAMVGALVIEEHTLQKSERAARSEQEMALRALLTPAQQARFDALPKGGPRRPGGERLARGFAPGPRPMGQRPPMTCDPGPAGCAGGPPPMGPPPMPPGGERPGARGARAAGGPAAADGLPDDGRP